MEPPEEVEAALQPPADQVVTQPVGQSSVNQPGPRGRPGTGQDQRQNRVVPDDWQHQQQGGHSVELEFQDSNLSPALSLLPVASRSQPNLNEYSLLQQSDIEFAPLRAYPDVSQASPRPPQDDTVQASEPDSLSQRPLATETILSVEGASSCCCSLSQHSLPPGEEGKPSGPTRQQEVEPRASRGSDREKERQKLSEDETYFLSQDVPALHLLDILQKEVGMPSSSSSAVSSASEMLMRREGPPGEASLPPPRPNRPSEVCNITVGSRSTLPDHSSESLHRELVSESQIRHRKSPSPPAQRLASHPSEPSVTRAVGGDLPSTGRRSAGVVRLHREHDLWSSGNQTAIDGSYLGFLPQSQSTPGIFQAPAKSSVAGKLSAIESDKENSAVSEPDLHRLEEHTSAKVQSLPSLNYMEKVDAWRANQSAGKPSLLDSLALQGFSGVSPKKRAYEAVSDSLNRILSDKARRLQQQPPPAEQSAAQSPSSSPRRGEAVGSAPSDKDNTGSRTRPFSSPFGKSQSHSSLSTVVMSTQKQKEEGRRASAAAHPSAAVDLGHFSDVSAEQDLDLTLSSSQDSSKSGVKLATSVGASSATSLEVDNYAPYWTSKPPSTPPPRELNIEERIPLYLRNLGIDQSPSTILTPFAPRGPIREPEFSPTDLCTIKGSTGTPTKSAQPSEGGSPHKAEFSRSSALSVDSSVSIPFSVDSLGPAASERTRPETLPADSAVVRSKIRPASASQRGEEDSAHSSIFHPSQQKDNTVLSGERFDPSLLSLVTRARTGEVGPSAAASVYPLPPHLMSDDDILLSLRRRTGQDSAFSLFGAASSSLWARSSSDSMLTSERTRQSSVGRESTTPSYPSAQPPTAAATEGPTLVLSKPARRAEPEGCSAAPPDNNAPQQQPPPPPAAAVTSLPQQLTSTPAETTASSEAEGTPAPVPGPPTSSAQEESDQGDEGSSQSSLAERVAKLLEDPSLLASSSPSTTDPEDGKGRERTKLKASAQQSEPLVLDEEDRKRIEEIKKELLLTFPMKNQLSSDTESSGASSDRVLRCRSAAHSTEMIPPQGGAVRHLAQLPRSLATNPSGSASLHQETVEAKFQKIAAREGVTLCRPHPRAPTSISIATCRRSSSPFPPASPAPPTCSTPELLHLSELSSGPHLRERQDTVGGRFEEPPPRPQEDGNTESFKLVDELSTENSALSGGHTPDSPASHVSHVRLTLSPKAAADRSSAPPPARPDNTVKPQPHGEFVLLRRSPATVVSPDEGVGLTSPPEWNETRESRSEVALHHRSVASKRVTIRESPAVPVLLPYKPRGSEELFYVPQFEADVSSAGRSDTTMESSHTGSDDAVPPRFGSDVLGHQDPGLDRGVGIRHSEGIYSKRLNTGNVCMEEPGHRDSSRTANRCSQSALGRTSHSPPASVDATRTSSKHHVTSDRERGTSPLHLPPDHRPLEPSPQTSEPQTGDEDVGPSSSQQQQVSLDELWRRFCVRWAIEQSRPTGGREASLLERLERLSRLIYSSSGAEERQEAESQRGEGGRRTPRVQRSSRPAGGSHASPGASQSLSLGPEDREASQTPSGSASTVDTDRLVRAFGAQRVRRPRSGSALDKLYSAIDKQRSGRSSDAVQHGAIESTEESSVVVDSESSTCTSALPAQPRASRTDVKLISKKIQTASDLEIVRNGTRRHTRDVGTTFPSPHEPVTMVSSSSSGSERGRRGPRSKTSQRQRKSKQNKPRPPPVSWFIPADDSPESRKENQQQPGEESALGPSAWFEPYTRTPAWREPLRQRQVQEDGMTQNGPHAEPGPHRTTKTPGAGLLTLQEALELRRPDFITRSVERMKRLSLQAEQRQQQAALIRERYGLFGQYMAAERLQRPAGAAQLRRAVPRKEMIQRSKQIYENLPEVRRRKAEERRKAEYRSYRLNAQLFNKRITNQVLGRRLAWQ